MVLLAVMSSHCPKSGLALRSGPSWGPNWPTVKQALMRSVKKLSLRSKNITSPRVRDMEADSNQTGMPSLKRCITQGIKQLYQTQQLCDVTLVAEGRMFPCHRAILASVSLYFQRMFTSSFKESREPEILLKELSASSLQTLLVYIYTGELVFTAGQATELFTAASRLQVMPALQIISRFLRESLAMENCLEFYMLAYSHNYRPLLRTTLSYVAFHFKHLSESPAFLLLDFSALISILSSDSLAVKSELAVYRAVRCWVRHNPSERLRKLGELMAHVRLPLMTPVELAEVQGDMEEFDQPVQLCWEELRDEKRLEACGGLRQGMYHEGVVCIGLPKWSEMSLGNEALDSHVHFFDLSTEQWEQLPDLKSLTFPGCTSMGHKLYIAGGRYLDNSCSDNLFVYDALWGRWSQLPSMSTTRVWHAFHLCKNKLYAAAGWDIMGPLASAECFDLERKEWVPISDLPLSLAYFASTTFKSKLYLIGGETNMGDPDMSTPFRGFLFYDLVSEAWNQVLMAFEFYEASAIALDTCIFVVGGLSADTTHGGRQFTGRCACLLEDGTMNQEVCIPPLPISISYPGVARWHKRIYVFGGDYNDCYSSAIHYWEPGLLTWTQCGACLPDPNYGAFGFGCVELKVPQKKFISLCQTKSATSPAQ
ncbi:kelch-like protein 2 [Eublepharis macularius]|uniref:Kelch-like protein 2 n=1 Tax=Eublepharis macularius TaxID=481883 RepID=A0AA97KK94_EUBMA|nr:kelch-like protein 2 [Eublepharis macularius]